MSPSKAEGHADGEEETRSDLIVVAELQSLSMSLNAERTGERLGIMAMKELGMNIRWPAGSGMTVSGQLGNLTIQDTLTVPSSPYEMLSARSVRIFAVSTRCVKESTTSMTFKEKFIESG